MLAISTTPDERLTPARRAKLAYIYVRQSSMTQVKHHQESTELQYRLVDRAVALGWPRERVQVVDEDLGKSGARPFAKGEIGGDDERGAFVDRRVLEGEVADVLGQRKLGDGELVL